LDIRPEERISSAEMSSSWVASLVVGVRRLLAEEGRREGGSKGGREEGKGGA